MFRLATENTFDFYFSYFFLDKVRRIVIDDCYDIEYRKCGKPVKIGENDWLCSNI